MSLSRTELTSRGSSKPRTLCRTSHTFDVLANFARYGTCAANKTQKRLVRLIVPFAYGAHVSRKLETSDTLPNLVLANFARFGTCAANKTSVLWKSNLARFRVLSNPWTNCRLWNTLVQHQNALYKRTYAISSKLFVHIFVSPLATLALSCVPWATPG